MGRIFFVLLALSAPLWAGPYPGAPAYDGDPPTDSTAFAAHDPRFQEWASGVLDFAPGFQDSRNPSAGRASYGSPANALGQADADPNLTYPAVSLGEGGRITLSFDLPIVNGPGFDFAVFENSPSDNQYLELALVEVSSNGTDFFRFHSTSLTQTTQQVSGDTSSTLGSIDPTDLNNLAGKYRAGFGTPFDLSELSADAGPLLDLSAIRYVRIIDVIGNINASSPVRDYYGNIINDPWPTLGNTSGFDLDAIGVLNVPEPASAPLLAAGLACFIGRRRR